MNDAGTKNQYLGHASQMYGAGLLHGICCQQGRHIATDPVIRDMAYGNAPAGAEQAYASYANGWDAAFYFAMSTRGVPAIGVAAAGLVTALLAVGDQISGSSI